MKKPKAVRRQKDVSGLGASGATSKSRDEAKKRRSVPRTSDAPGIEVPFAPIAPELNRGREAGLGPVAAEKPLGSAEIAAQERTMTSPAASAHRQRSSNDDTASATRIEKPQMFGDRLKRVMEEKGISQTELARRIPLERSELNRTLNNKRTPRGDEIGWIAGALGVRPELLLEGIEMSLPADVQRTIARTEIAARRILVAQGEREEAVAKCRILEDSLTTERTAWENERRALEESAASECRILRERVSTLESSLQKSQEEIVKSRARHDEESTAIREHANTQMFAFQMQAAAREDTLRKQIVMLEHSLNTAKYLHKIDEARLRSQAEQIQRLQQSATSLQQNASTGLVATGLVASLLGLAVGAVVSSGGNSNEDD